MNSRNNYWPSISCVLPAYNEAQNLTIVIPELVNYLSQLPTSFEIIIVNDGSKDNTNAVAQQLCEQFPSVVFVSLSRNFGKEAAIAAGLAHTKGEVTILMDADGQHPFQYIKTMIEKWQSGVDVVYAVRKTRDDQGKLQIGLTGVFYKMVNWGTKVKIPPNAGDFRLMDQQVVKALNLLPEKNRFMKGLYAWVGFNSVAIEYEPLERLSGQSQFGFMGSMRLAITGLLAFSTLPLKLLTLIGGLISTLSIAYGAFMVFGYFYYGTTVPGYATLAVSMMFFSGIQLLAIGTIAAYIGRIYEEVKHRPLYLVQQHIGQGLVQGSVHKQL